MGGNNPLIVHDASDIRALVYNTIQSAFITAGQRCTCARRLILTINSKNEEFLQALIKNVANIKIGQNSDMPEPFMGPVISNAAATNILNSYQELIKNGAKVLAPILRKDPSSPFLTPGILDVTNVKKREDREIFGPLLQVIWVKDFNAALVEANNTAYGLSSGIFTDNKKYYDEFYSKIRAGIVNWNRPLTGSSSSAPFGGIGKSGNHRPSAYYAADYCAYPVASIEVSKIGLPNTLSPGLSID